MFEDKEEKAREEIIDYALKLSRAGLNVNSSGNLSVRFDSPEGKGFLITPTGLPYDETKPEDLVRILFTDNGCYKAVGIHIGGHRFYTRAGPFQQDRQP